MGSATLNKTLLSLTFLALAALPLAAAGPGASADTLSGDGARCTADGYSWNDYGGGNGTWWWSEGSFSSEACADHYDYATVEAHDDEGEVASLTLSASHENESRWGHSTSSWSTYDYSTWGSSSYVFEEESWSRGAVLSTRGGDATASYGCADAASRNSSYWSSSDAYGSRGDSAYNSGYASRCGLDAAALGESAFAGTTCRAESRDSGWYTAWNGYARDEETWTYRDGCLTGAETDAATAGWTSSCASDGIRRSESTWDGNETTYASWSMQDTTCVSGVTVVGPDGAVVFAGTQMEDEYDCGNGECFTNQRRAGVVRLDWEHHPLQPGGQSYYVPLP